MQFTGPVAQFVERRPCKRPFSKKRRWKIFFAHVFVKKVPWEAEVSGSTWPL